MNSKVDFFFIKSKKWQEELNLLRIILMACGLTEELKWGVPCYTLHKRNVILIHSFKEYCAILFFKGSLLMDTDNILIQQTENVQSARQIRFTNTQNIIKREPIIKAYVIEAVEVEKSGLKVAFKKNTAFTIPNELQIIFSNTPALKTAFISLTPGRQRAYLLYFAASKQSKTRLSRIEKYIPKILAGKGLND